MQEGCGGGGGIVDFSFESFYSISSLSRIGAISVSLARVLCYSFYSRSGSVFLSSSISASSQFCSVQFVEEE